MPGLRLFVVALLVSLAPSAVALGPSSADPVRACSFVDAVVVAFAGCTGPSVPGPCEDGSAGWVVDPLTGERSVYQTWEWSEGSTSWASGDPWSGEAEGYEVRLWRESNGVPGLQREAGECDGAPRAADAAVARVFVPVDPLVRDCYGVGCGSAPDPCSGAASLPVTGRPLYVTWEESEGPAPWAPLAFPEDRHGTRIQVWQESNDEQGLQRDAGGCASSSPDTLVLDVLVPDEPPTRTCYFLGCWG